MIEEKAKSSVWSIAMFAVIIFLSAIAFDGAFMERSSNTTNISAASAN
ncbi:MAG: hypothetical protein AB8B49_08590 [Nitratireductor sp.]